MPHGIAYESGGDARAFSRCRPGMPRHVERERHGQGETLAQSAQMVADGLRTALELFPPFRPFRGDERKKIIAPFSFVSADDFLHLGNPFHGYHTAGLMTPISQPARRNVLFPEMRHVDGCHATRDKREDEHVARQLLFPAFGFHGGNPAYVIHRQRPLACSRLARVDVIKKIFGQSRDKLLLRPVADGTQDAEIKRLRVFCRSTLLEVIGKGSHRARRDSLPRDRFSGAKETVPTIKGGAVSLRRAKLARRLFLGDNIPHKLHHVAPGTRLGDVVVAHYRDTDLESGSDKVEQLP